MKEKSVILKMHSKKLCLCRVVAAFLVLVMTAGAFAGCRKEGETETTAGKTVTATGTVTGIVTGRATSNASAATTTKTTTGDAEATPGETSERQESSTVGTDETGGGEYLKTDTETETDGDTDAETEHKDQAKTYDLKGRELRLVTHSKTLGYPDPENDTRTC